MSGPANPQPAPGAQPPGHGSDQASHAGFDREIATGVLYKSSLALLVVTVLSMTAMWMMLSIFQAEAAKLDRRPSPLAEANQRNLPPAPRLQVEPEMELQALRAEKAERLNSYGWNDRAHETIHIPIDKAMELLLADAERLQPRLQPRLNPLLNPVAAPTAPAVAGERP